MIGHSSAGPAGSDNVVSSGGNALFDFYDDWDDDYEDGDVFSGVQRGNARDNRVDSGDGMDEEDRRFFEELSRGFSAKDAEIEHSAAAGEVNEKSVERNELMDDTRATRQMLKASRNANLNEGA